MAIYSIGDILYDSIYDKYCLVEDVIFNTMLGEYHYCVIYLEENARTRIRVSEIHHEESGFEKVA